MCNPFSSRVNLYSSNFNLTSTLDFVTSTMASTNNRHRGMEFLMSLESSSRIVVNKKGLELNLSIDPLEQEKGYVSLIGV